jgi:adenylate cyclase
LVGGGRLFDWGAPVFVAWGLFLALALVVYRRERQKRERAVAMFGRMVAPSVVSQLVDDGATPESLSGLKREITVMFSDIRGFTSLSETRAPEEIVAILNRYFARQSAVILRHGGTLDKFIGDGIMAFWGAPLHDPAHAQHAVHAALEMVEELQKFKDELSREGATFADGFEVGIGLHSGPAVVGFIGSTQKSDFTAIGDTVNLASRVEGLTKGVAHILVTDATRNACGASFDFVERGTYRVKGRVQDTVVYEPNRKSS